MSCTTFWLTLPDRYTSEDSIYTVGFQFNEIRIRVDTYVWMLLEHFGYVAVGIFMVMECKRFRAAIFCFLGLQIMDTVGWILAYEDPMKGMPITFNEIKIVLFIFVIAFELIPLWKMKGRN